MSIRCNLLPVLRRDLGVTQKTAWHLAHRIRKAWEAGKDLLGGPVETDESYLGRLEKNKHTNKRWHVRGASNKEIVLDTKALRTGRSQGRTFTLRRSRTSIG